MRLQHENILNAARELNIFIKDVSETLGFDAAILNHRGQNELLIRGTPTSMINVRSSYFCDNKQLTKEVFRKLKIKHPKSVSFKKSEKEKTANFLKAGKSYVCKPVDGTNGIGVGMNISEKEDLEKYFSENSFEEGQIILLEEQISGDDLRTQVIGGKIVAVCTRRPPFVVGNGQKRLSDLISELEKKVIEQNPENKLFVDKNLIANQNIELSEIPKKGREILLNRTSNMAQGAMAIDKTEEFHPDFQIWVDRLVGFLKTDYFAIDIIAEDCRRSPESGAFALEINARPEWMHHTFSQHKQHDIPQILLKSIFNLS